MAENQKPEQQTIQELEKALKEARAQQDESLRELENLARYLSHDLRAPLRGIDGYSKALMEDYADRLDPLAISYLQFISDSGRQAAIVLDRLIQYIRIPHAALKLEDVDLSALAEDRLAALENRARASGTPRRVNCAVQPGLCAPADETQMRVLLEALLENAWKFSAFTIPAHITFGARAMATAGGEIAYFVQDDGAGFNPIYTSQLFQPFQRLHSAHEFEGVGMGLAVARRIVQRHGGRIWAEGQPDQGATIYFTLQTYGWAVAAKDTPQ